VDELARGKRVARTPGRGNSRQLINDERGIPIDLIKPGQVILGHPGHCLAVEEIEALRGRIVDPISAGSLSKLQRASINSPAP